MPLVAATSYLPTLTQFLAHWVVVDEHLPSGAKLVLGDGMSLAMAEALRVETETAVNALDDARQDLVIQHTELRLLRARLREWLDVFNQTVRARYGGTLWEEQLRPLPALAASAEKLLTACRSALLLWARLDALPATPGAPVPLCLGFDMTFTREDFAAQMSAVQEQAQAVESAEFDRIVARRLRDAVFLRVKEMLMAYVRMVEARLPAAEPLRLSLPRLWPLPGHTPEPVELTGIWDAVLQRARLSWTESTDKTLDHYQIRVCSGPEYDGEEERVVKRIPGTAPERVLLTIEALTQPGTEATYRVYVVLKTDNERASNPVTIKHPPEIIRPGPQQLGFTFSE